MRAMNSLALETLWYNARAILEERIAIEKGNIQIVYRGESKMLIVGWIPEGDDDLGLLGWCDCEPNASKSEFLFALGAAFNGLHTALVINGMEHLEVDAQFESFTRGLFQFNLSSDQIRIQNALDKL